MLLTGWHISKTWFFFTVLVSIAFAYPYPQKDKTFNLKIGFDLLHGDHGSPSLRIRDFEESREYHPRADKEEEESKKDDEKADLADDRANSDSGSGESKSKEKTDVKSKKPIKADKDSNSSESRDTAEGADDNKRITRGLSPQEYEPEETRGHKRNPNPDDDDRRRRRRRKRAIKLYNYHLQNRMRR